MNDNNDFEKVMESGITDEALVYKLEQELEYEKNNTVRQPDKVSQLEKQLKLAKEKLNSQPKKDTLNSDIVPNEKLEQENDQKEQNQGAEPNKQEDNATVKGYEDAIQRLHDFRIKMYGKQRADKKLVCSEKEYVQELQLEKMKKDLKEGLSEEDRQNLRSEEEKLSQEERKAKEPILAEIRERSRKYAELMVKLYDINQELQYIHESFQNNKISQEDYDKRYSIALEEKIRIKEEIEKINPSELMETLEIEKRRKVERNNFLGINYESQEYRQASLGEKRNLKYVHEKQIKQEANLKFAENESKNNPKQSLEERQNHIKLLSEELKELPDDDIERRLEILKELEKETILLEKDQNIMNRIDKGEEVTKEEELKQEAVVQKEIARVEKDNNKDYELTQQAIKENDKNEGQKVVESPENIEEIRQEREEKIMEAGIITAAVVGDENDTIEQDMTQAAQGAIAADLYMPRNDFEKQLHESTVNVENPEEAKAYIAKQKAIDELAENQKYIESKVNEKI